MARTKKSEADKFVNIGVKVSPELKAELDHGAAQLEIPVGTYARQLIRAGLQNRAESGNVSLTQNQQRMLSCFSRLPIGAQTILLDLSEAFEQSVARSEGRNSEDHSIRTAPPAKIGKEQPPMNRARTQDVNTLPEYPEDQMTEEMKEQRKKWKETA